MCSARPAARWYYSPGGTGAFVPLTASGTRVSSLRFGDFDGDGRTDVFTTSAEQWQFSSAGLHRLAAAGHLGRGPGIAAVRRLQRRRQDRRVPDQRRPVVLLLGRARPAGSRWRSSGEAITALAFGDFDGDGRTDVFDTSGSQWRYSSGGAGSWQPLATASEALSALTFRRLRRRRQDRRVQHLRQSVALLLGRRDQLDHPGSSGCPLASLYVAGDFNGDGKSDVFDGRCGG